MLPLVSTTVGSATQMSILPITIGYSLPTHAVLDTSYQELSKLLELKLLTSKSEIKLELDALLMLA